MEELHFTRHKFMLVTVKEWLKSVLNNRSYPKNNTGYPFFGPPCTLHSPEKHGDECQIQVRYQVAAKSK